MNKISMVLIGILLFGIASMAYAQEQKVIFATDSKTYDQDDAVKFTVKNDGEQPLFALDKVIVTGGTENMNIQVINSSAELIIFPGKSYTWQWTAKENEKFTGEFTGKIYVSFNMTGDFKPIMTEKFKKEGSDAPKLFTNKRAYKYMQKVKIAFKNYGDKTIYVNKENWSLTSTSTGKAIDIDVSKRLGDRDDSKNGDKDKITERIGKITETYYKLEPGDSLFIIWNQKDENGKHVALDSYFISARYSYDKKVSNILKSKDITLLKPKTEEEKNSD